MAHCPCGSNKQFKDCCEPALLGTVLPSTAEALMRSRYTAYTKHLVDFIYRSHHPSTRDNLDLEQVKQWSEQSTWQGLEILHTEAGGPMDNRGIVEFKASYQQDGKDYEHHEVSTFEKVEGQWFFKDGQTPVRTVERAAPKVGRNDPCPCGSGKKYKKCCQAV